MSAIHPSETEPLLANKIHQQGNQEINPNQSEPDANLSSSLNSTAVHVNSDGIPSTSPSISSPTITTTSMVLKFIQRYRFLLASFISLVIITWIFYLQLVLLPFRIQDGANAPGLIIDRITIYNISEKGILFHLDATRPPSADIAPIAVTKQASQFEIVANRRQQSFFFDCGVEKIPVMNHSDIIDKSLMSMLSLSLFDWSNYPSDQELIHSFNESIVVVSIKIPDITIPAWSNKIRFDALIDLTNSFNATHINLYYLTSILQEFLYDRQETPSITTRLQSRPFFMLDWLGKYKVPMWSYRSIDFKSAASSNFTSSSPNISIVDGRCDVGNLSHCSIKFTVSLHMDANIDLIQSPQLAISGNLMYNNITVAAVSLLSIRAHRGVVVLGIHFSVVPKGIPALMACIGDLGEKGRVVIEFANGRVDYFIENYNNRILWLDDYLRTLRIAIPILAEDIPEQYRGVTTQNDVTSGLWLLVPGAKSIPSTVTY